MACISQGRVPLLIRTPRCQLSKDEVLHQISELLALDDRHQLIDLRSLYAQALGKPSHVKNAQKQEIRNTVRAAVESQQLLVLNFDDPEPYVEETITQTQISQMQSLHSTAQITNQSQPVIPSAT